MALVSLPRICCTSSLIEHWRGPVRRLLLITLLLAGCGTKDIPLPEVQPVKDDLSTFQTPALYVPPPAAVETPPPPAPKKRAANEERYAWNDGEAYPVLVQVGYPTLVRFQPGEVITSVMDGDREYVSESEDKPAPSQDKRPNCFYGPRWEYCRGVSEGNATPIEHLVFTAVHHNGRSHKTGVVAFTDQRAYYLELQAVKQTRTRLVSWTVPPPPPPPPKPKVPGLFPDMAEARQYHVGYTYTIPHATPDFTPLGVWSDSKVYIQFSPTVLHQRIPVIRGMDAAGKPFLVNTRQYRNWVVVDELPPRIELRSGTKDEGLTVILTRGELRTIECPGGPECPRFP
jgi:type IV secretory pathway VirB9-like protein